MYLDFGPHFARLSGYPYAQAETCELDDISLNGFSDAYIQRCRLISGFYGTKTQMKLEKFVNGTDKQVIESRIIEILGDLRYQQGNTLKTHSSWAERLSWECEMNKHLLLTKCA